MDFDPAVVDYEALLALFWSSHNPTSPAFSTQYASLVLAHDERQLAVARMSRDRIEAVFGRPVLTRIEMLDRFYPAEDYHQKYRLRNAPALMREFTAMYPADADFVASTAAARVNGILDGGGGGCGRLVDEIGSYGLSDAGRSYLLARCRG